MKTIVIYKSKTGFTKKYADWIAESLSCKAIPIESENTIDLSHYDTLVFGGWFFAGSISGLKEFKEKFLTFKGKKAVFATGAMPSESPEAIQRVNSHFTNEERKNIGVFYMQGGLNYSHMGFINKTMMKMMCKIMKKKKGVDSIEYKSISQSFDATNKTLIQPLIKYILDM